MHSPLLSTGASMSTTFLLVKFSGCCDGSWRLVNALTTFVDGNVHEHHLSPGQGQRLL